MSKVIYWAKSEEIDNLKFFLEEKGLSYEDVSRIYGCSVEAVYEVRKKYGIKYKYGRTPNSWTEEEISLLRDLLNKKLSYDELIEYFPNHSIQSIVGIVRQRGKKLNLSYKGNRRRYLDPELESEVLSVARKENLIPKELSKIFNCNDTRIRRLLEDNDVHKLTRKEKYRLGIFGNVKTGLTEEVLKERIISHTIKEISIEFGISIDSVRRSMKDLGIISPRTVKSSEVIEKEILRRNKIIPMYRQALGREPNEEDLRIPLYKVYTKERIEEVFKKNDYSIKKSSEELLISISLFSKVKRLLGVKTPKVPTLSDFDPEYIKNLYLKDKMTPNDISDLLGINKEAVRKFLSKNCPEGRKNGKYSSFGEKMIASCLDNLKLSFNYNKKILGVAPGIRIDGRVFIDFVVNYKSNTFWTEYNGKQHYKNVSWFNGKGTKGIKRFNEQRKRDTYVRLYCKNNNIILIEIPYTIDTSSEIINILNDCIFLRKDPSEVIDYSFLNNL